MKCKDVELNIYLFAEVTEGERLEVREHIKTCSACAKLFAEVEETSKLTSRVASTKQIPENAARLTNRVMQALPEPPVRESMLDFVLRIFDLSTLRYSMAVASLMFIGVFITQVQEPEGIVVSQSYTKGRSGGVVIRSSGLRQEFIYREKRASLFECTGGLDTKIDLNCIREKIQKISF